MRLLSHRFMFMGEEWRIKFCKPPNPDRDWCKPLDKQPYAHTIGDHRTIYINPRKRPRKGLSRAEELSNTHAHELLHIFNWCSGGALPHDAIYKLSVPFGKWMLENAIKVRRPAAAASRTTRKAVSKSPGVRRAKRRRS